MAPKSRAKLFPVSLADLDIEAFDLLVQRRQRDVELLSGVCLIPVAALELLDDDAALDILKNVEK